MRRSWRRNGPRRSSIIKSATKVILQTSIALLGGEAVEAIGHRVVHGGTQFTAPTRVTNSILASLKALSPLAPLHQPHNIAPIEAIMAEAPHMPQVVCFDTAFHQTQPQVAQMFALPREITDAGVRRYGFHGLSYEFVSDRLRTVAPDPLRSASSLPISAMAQASAAFIAGAALQRPWDLLPLTA